MMLVSAALRVFSQDLCLGKKNLKLFRKLDCVVVLVKQIIFLSDYVAVLDSTGKIKGGAICKSSSKSPLLVYSRRAASILLHSSGEGGNNGKGFRLRFRTIDWEPSGCGDPKKYVLASNDPIHISYVFFHYKDIFYFIDLIFC